MIITALREIESRRFRTDVVVAATRVDLYTDSQYVVDNLGARFLKAARAPAILFANVENDRTHLGPPRSTIESRNLIQTSR